LIKDDDDDDENDCEQSDVVSLLLNLAYIPEFVGKLNSIFYYINNIMDGEF
jgi:hypothetical protein